MDFAARLVTARSNQVQALANAGYWEGQVALLTELLAEQPAAAPLGPLEPPEPPAPSPLEVP